MNNIFLAVKEAVSTRQAAEAYGIHVNRNGMACCPFHEDHHPSMKIDERYYCFGCHKTGDVIAFTAKLFGLSPYEAGRKLVADFHVLPDPPVATRLKVQQAVQKNEKLVEISRYVSILVNYEALLKRWQTEYAPERPDEAWHPRFAAALQELPGISDILGVFIPDMEQMQTELKKYKKTFEEIEAIRAENTELKAKANEKANQSIDDQLKLAKLQLEYQSAINLIQRILEEILEDYRKINRQRVIHQDSR